MTMITNRNILCWLRIIIDDVIEVQSNPLYVGLRCYIWVRNTCDLGSNQVLLGFTSNLSYVRVSFRSKSSFNSVST